MTALLIAIGLCLASPVMARKEVDAPLRDARITDASGSVTLRTAEKPKELVVVDEETPLDPGDILETGPKSKAELTLDGQAVLTLQSNTILKIKKIYLKNTQLDLALGGIIGKVAHADTEEQGLILKLPTAVVAIRGTEFAAETADSIAHVAVLDEGQVVVAGAWGKEHVMLGPNEETRVTLSNVPRPPERIAHLKRYRKQLPQVRRRATYWHRNWKPLSAQRKQDIRRRLADPTRKPSPTFRRPVPPHSASTGAQKRKAGTPKKRGSSRSSGRRPSRPPA